MKHRAVIERLQRIRQFYRDIIVEYTAVEAIDLAISALEKQQQDRWIPVTERLPSADVVPVVRCKDCKNRESDGFCVGRGFPYQLVPDDGFCDKGKRREEQTNDKT